MEPAQEDRPRNGHHVQRRPLGAAEEQANLTNAQIETRKKFRAHGGRVWLGYQLKEGFRAIFKGDLNPAQVTTMLDKWITKALRSGIPEFAKVSRLIKKHRDGILAAIHLGINNGRSEGLNNVVRLITRRARGFHAAHAALALVMLTCGPITHTLPHEQPIK